MAQAQAIDTGEVRERLPRHLKVTPLPSLEDLAATANREHAACEQAQGAALAHGIACGHALLAAREQVERGTWRRWLSENFEGSQSLSSVYIRLATYEDRLTPDMSISQARGLVTFLPNATTNDANLIYDDPELHAEARRLIASGMTQDKAAAQLGVSRGALRRWIDPERRAAASARYSAKRHRERMALREVERQKQLRAAVRKAGAGLSEAYSMTARMAKVLAQAEAEATTDEARAALEDATAHYHKMSDAIVRALGVS